VRASAAWHVCVSCAAPRARAGRVLLSRRFARRPAVIPRALLTSNFVLILTPHTGRDDGRGTSFLAEVDELFHEVFPDVCAGIDSASPAQAQEQVSMAVSVADLDGRSPNVQLGQGPVTPGSSSLFLRRQASKKGTDINLADPDSMSVPGSLAVSAAQVDGGSPSLKLRSDEGGTLLGRRSAKGTPVSTPTSSAARAGSPMAMSPVPTPTQEILSWAVSADEAEGKETIISNNPKAALLSRRSSMKSSPAPAPRDEEGAEELNGTIMTSTASEMEGEMVSPSLALGADSNFKASIFNRRKSQKAECTLASTTTLSALGDQPTPVSLGANPAEKSGLLQRRQSQRAAGAGCAEAGGSKDVPEIMEPQMIASFAVIYPPARPLPAFHPRAPLPHPPSSPGTQPVVCPPSLQPRSISAPALCGICGR